MAPPAATMEANPVPSSSTASTTPSDTLPSPAGVAFCDNRPNLSSRNIESHLTSPVQENSVSEVCSGSAGVPDGATAPPLSDDDEDAERSFEIRVFHPPDPFRNDNQAADSESDSDNETARVICGPGGANVGTNEVDGDFSKRSRRVDFCSNVVVSAMYPLTVDVDLDHHRLGGSLDNLRGVGGGGSDALTLGYEHDDSLLSKDPFRGTSANTILKRLLSNSSDNEDVNLNSKNTLSKDMTKNDVYPPEDNYLGDVYPPRDDPDLIERRSPDGETDETDSCHPRKEIKDHQTFSRSPNLRRQNCLSPDTRSLTGVSPQLTGVSGVSSQLTGVSPQLTGVSPQLTPTGSGTSSHNATDNSSESGSGRRIRMTTPMPETEVCSRLKIVYISY